MHSLLIASLLALAAPPDDDLIWIEGEAAKTKEVSPPHNWYNSVKKELLSGGDWISNYGDKDGFANKSMPQMVEALKGAGGTPKFTEYPGVGHNSWDKAYGTKELFDWLIMQTKKQP